MTVLSFVKNFLKVDPGSTLILDQLSFTLVRMTISIFGFLIISEILLKFLTMQLCFKKF